jgi:hypothetical protein
MGRYNPDKDHVFMSYNGRRIWVRIVNLEPVYMVAKGDGTDEYFTDWKDAMEWIDAKRKERKQ